MTWSIVAGLLGVLGTWVGMSRLTQRQGSPGPRVYWILGLVSLLPAWLTAFVGLLGTSTGGRPDLVFALSWILSASAALAGVILTDATMTRQWEAGSAPRPVAYWLLGVAALLPAWAIALAGLAWIQP